MYVYKIGYGGFEESGSIELCHEDKFTKEQMTDMIAEAVIYKIRNKDEYDYFYGYDHFINEFVAMYLIKEKGFSTVEYELVWEGCCNASMFYEAEHSSYRLPDEHHELIRLLNDAGIDKSYDDFLRLDKEYEEEK